ncbi:MAG: class I SAM-dependent methyltransferase [Okeania sp. SIO3I5]|uniref:class I SAM-dependent methyltransferase n=1 Tax=Okeania sp. SIO3I5 TaxID=2607805 RepID=UPI0013B778ED|nr:class I SAM-dependent methyltransferase [Okeania sp. SIO3I5]NEQ36720.1 class I SAM-dependent methyltransferase [Okeania sp. SIO3I5]
MSGSLEQGKLTAINEKNKDFATKQLSKNILRYPDEHIVRFLSKIKTEEKVNLEGLDIGFGSGQHLKLLMDFGYRASGVEFVPEACDRVRQFYGDSQLFGDIFIGDFRNTNLPANKFDVVICWGVVFLRSLEEMQTDLKYIFELLRPGGQLCVNFRTKENWFYGLGTQLDEDYFLLDERADVYAGCHYTFVDESVVRNLITKAGFELENIELYNWWKNNMKEKHSWLIVGCKRPN